MVGWPFKLLLLYIREGYTPSSSSFNISSLVTTIAKATTSHYTSNFRHPILSAAEHANGARLGIDSWADTCCAGKHCYVQEFVEGKTVTASGFTSSLGTITNLPIANVLYAYDDPRGHVLILECNNAIYLGDKMTDSLLNPVQCEENDARIDMRPRLYYPNVDTAQSMTFADGTRLNIPYDGVLPYLPVRRPTKEEIHT